MVVRVVVRGEHDQDGTAESAVDMIGHDTFKNGALEDPIELTAENGRSCRMPSDLLLSGPADFVFPRQLARCALSPIEELARLLQLVWPERERGAQSQGQPFRCRGHPDVAFLWLARAALLRPAPGRYRK